MFEGRYSLDLNQRKAATKPFEQPQLNQDPWEFNRMCEEVKELRPRYVMEIGCFQGGSLRGWIENAHPEAEILALSNDITKEKEQLWRGFLAPGQKLHCLKELSQAPTTRRKVAEIMPVIDFLFIDGGHKFDVVHFDYDTYGRLVRPGGIIALHDIKVREPAQPALQVYQLWEMIVASGRKTRVLSRSSRNGYGIGVVYVEQALHG